MAERQWRTIESAPMDGTLVLLWNGRAEVGHWWTEHDDDGSRAGYFADRYNDPIGPYPTHWMPLPAPPGSQAVQTPEDERAQAEQEET